MKVSVFGAGNMGARIAEVFLKAGHAGYDDRYQGAVLRRR